MNQVVVGDRISELPLEILDNILGRLPIHNAVATTILSRKWKDKWVDVSNLVFDEDDYSNKTGTMDTKKFTKLVYHVLLSHRSTIDKFTLTSRLKSKSYSFEYNLRSWITFLSRKDTKELTFYFPPPIGQALPYSLFSCTKLRRLCITNCWVKMPVDFSGFRDLVSLHLTSCSYTDETIKKLISSSPNLEKLVLADVRFRELISIYAPSLNYLSVEGDFGDVSLENCPLLHDASIKMTKKGKGTSNNLVPLPPPDWLCCTRRLVMSGHFLKCLAERYNWHGASVDYHNLEVLELDTVHFDDSDEMAVALSILRRSSNLNVLIINGVGTYKTDIYRSAEALNQGKCCFNKLRLVRITILRKYSRRKDIPKGSETEDTSFLGIIRLLLAGSPVLENMDIHYYYFETCDIWFMKKLLSCERASSQLKLTYKSF